MAKDTELPTIAATPALGFSMQVDLGAGRVATLQTFLPNDCDIVELNKMLDKMTVAGDRQRAHYQIEGLERDLAELEKRQIQHREDLIKIEDDFIAEQKTRAMKIEASKKEIAQRQGSHNAAAEERGVRDPSRMKSTDAARIKQLETVIAATEAEMAVATDDDLPYATAKRGAQLTIDTTAAQIAQKKAEIERHRKIVADGLKA